MYLYLFLVMAEGGEDMGEGYADCVQIRCY